MKFFLYFFALCLSLSRYNPAALAVENELLTCNQILRGASCNSISKNTEAYKLCCLNNSNSISLENCNLNRDKTQITCVDSNGNRKVFLSNEEAHSFTHGHNDSRLEGVRAGASKIAQEAIDASSMIDSSSSSEPTE